MASERTKQLGIKVSVATDAALDRLAQTHETKTRAIEHAIDLMTDPDIAAVVGDAMFAHKQGLLLLCELLHPACRAVESKFDQAEWSLIADANNGCAPLFNVVGHELRHATMLLHANVADDIRLNGGDRKWLSDDPKEAAKRGKQLVAKMIELDQLERWAVLLAVQFFWADAGPGPRRNKIGQDDPWWTLEYRREYIRGLASGDNKD